MQKQARNGSRAGKGIQHTTSRLQSSASIVLQTMVHLTLENMYSGGNTTIINQLRILIKNPSAWIQIDEFLSSLIMVAVHVCFTFFSFTLELPSHSYLIYTFVFKKNQPRMGLRTPLVLSAP